MRSFSLDAIRSTKVLDRNAKPVAEKTLNEVLASSYGIFSGKADKLAKLRFTPKQARWVSSEQWHPEQVSQFDKDGSYLLEFPYSNDGELIMDSRSKKINEVSMHDVFGGHTVTWPLSSHCFARAFSKYRRRGFNRAGDSR